MLFLFCCTRFANTLHLNTKLLQPESGRQFALQLYGFDELEFEVKD